jgi:hypothetical protein
MQYNTVMATQPAQYDLTDRQRKRLQALAERTGKSCAALVDEFLDSEAHVQDGSENVVPPESKSLHDVLEERGILGCFDGPTDLATNPRHMEGFGRDAFGDDSN